LSYVHCFFKNINTSIVMTLDYVKIVSFLIKLSNIQNRLIFALFQSFEVYGERFFTVV
jgi:hypothetical protein